MDHETMTLETFKEAYDWGGCYDRQEGAVYEAAKRPDPVPGFTGAAAWALDDVEEVVAADAGENDERDWVAVLRLTDGRFVFMSAGCDFTGWDCQAGGRSLVGDSMESLMQLGMTADERERLKLGMRIAA